MSKLMLGMAAAIAAATLTASAQGAPRAFAGEIAHGWFSVAIPVGDFNSADYQLTGPGFHIVASRTDQGRVQPTIDCALPGCQSGDLVDLSSMFANVNHGSGQATVHGETLSDAYFTGMFDFQAGTASIPRGSRKSLVLTAPFTLVIHGRALDVFTSSAGRQIGEGLWASGTVSGSGTATAFLERVRNEHDWFYVVRQVVYTFGVEANGGSQTSRGGAGGFPPEAGGTRALPIVPVRPAAHVR